MVAVQVEIVFSMEKLSTRLEFEIKMKYLSPFFIRKELRFRGCTKFAKIAPPDTVRQKGQFLQVS